MIGTPWGQNAAACSLAQHGGWNRLNPARLTRSFQRISYIMLSGKAIYSRFGNRTSISKAVASNGRQNSASVADNQSVR